MQTIKEKKEGNKKPKSKNVEFPLISIGKAIQIIKGTFGEYGSVIIPYSDFQRLVGIKGGALSTYVRALKDYELIDNFSKSEYKLTELGERVLKEPMKFDVQNAVLAIRIFYKIYTRYEASLGDINKKLIEKYLVESESIDESIAGRVASIFLSSFDYINSLSENNVSETKEKKITVESFDINFYRMARLLGNLTPASEVDKAQADINELEKLAKQFNLRTFTGAISTFKAYLESTKDDQTVFDTPEGLKRNVISAFEEDVKHMLSKEKK